jgi:YVTN family beta-propeller protein
MKRTLRFLVLAHLVLLPGCVKNPTSVQPVIPIPSAKGVYIVNEGVFQRSNSTLSYYDLSSFQIYNDVFEAVNHRQLGDVGTGMIIRGSRGYIVVNNSDKIEILDLATNISVGTIATGSGTSPKRLAFVNDSLALVTNLYANSVGIIDIPHQRVAGTIAVGSNPDGITLAEGKAFVANSGFGFGNTVSVLDLTSATPSVIATITVGVNPGGIHPGASGRIYVVCAGSYGDYSDPNDDTPCQLYLIDPISLKVADSVFIGGHAFDMAISDVDGTGYVPTADSVVRVDTRADRRIGLFLAGSYYSVGVEEVSGDVYLADPRNYTTPGTIYVYSSTGQLRTSFDAGVVPGWFAFKR